MPRVHPRGSKASKRAREPIQPRMLVEKLGPPDTAESAMSLHSSALVCNSPTNRTYRGNYLVLGAVNGGGEGKARMMGDWAGGAVRAFLSLRIEKARRQPSP